MELTDNDRQRIKEWAANYFGKDTLGGINAFIGAEYEHKYQREQQAELRNKVIEECIEKVRYSYNLSLGATDTVVELLNSLKK